MLSREEKENVMLRYALIFLVIGLVAALLGFTGVAGASFAIAKVLALVFGLLFVVFLLIGVIGANRVVS